MIKPNIISSPGECVRCSACQLICSLTYTGAFNPDQACIVINPPDEIRFTEECRNGCTLCTKYCEFRAIVRAMEETTMRKKEG